MWRSAETSIITKARELDKMPRADHSRRSGGWMNWTTRALVSGALFLTLFFAAAQIPLAHAQTPNPNPAVPAASAAPAQAFDVKAAVDAYLATVPAAQRARSDAYFEGGYWLQLW